MVPIAVCALIDVFARQLSNAEWLGEISSICHSHSADIENFAIQKSANARCQNACPFIVSAECLKLFEDGANEYNELIVVRGIPVYSHCGHHLAPFFG